MQSEMVDVAPSAAPPPDELDKTYASYLILAYLLHYVKIRRHP